MTTRMGQNNLIWLILLGFASFVFLAATANALEPKLLREKKLKRELKDISMAHDTGDVILSDNEVIILYDKDGKERFHWGPRVDRDAGSVDISADGSIIVFMSSWKELYKEKRKLKGWDERVHYMTKKGKELWNAQWPGYVRLSEDATKLILNYGGGEGQGFNVLDATGNELWGKEDESWGGITTKFSPDGNFIGVVGDLEAPLMLMKSNDGSILWTTNERHPGVASISLDANYISTFPNYGGPSHPERTHNGKVYDKNGSAVLDGFGILSADGSKIVMLYKDKVSVLSLPSKTVIQEFSISTPSDALSPFFLSAAFSYDGRYLAVIGKKESSQNNLFVIDLNTSHSWETNVGQIEPEHEEDRTYLYFSKNGKYLLIVGWKEKIIRMFKLF